MASTPTGIGPVMAVVLLSLVGIASPAARAHSDGHLRRQGDFPPVAAGDSQPRDTSSASGITVESDGNVAATSSTVLIASEYSPSLAQSIDPDSGVVINWTALDDIVSTFNVTAPQSWLPPQTSKCRCSHMQYRPLYCPWYLKPFRDAYDFVVTETEKWPTSRKLLGCRSSSTSATRISTNTDDDNNSGQGCEDDDEDMLNGRHHTGLPMLAYFGTECCRVYANATQAFIALTSFDPCWYETDELYKCFGEGRYVPRERTNLTADQHEMLLGNATYADLATPHL